VYLTLNWLNLYAYGVLLLRTDGRTARRGAIMMRDALRAMPCIEVSRGKRKKKKNIKKEK